MSNPETPDIEEEAAVVSDRRMDVDLRTGTHVDRSEALERSKTRSLKRQGRV
jgi:hypothetical protein